MCSAVAVVQCSGPSFGLGQRCSSRLCATGSGLITRSAWRRGQRVEPQACAQINDLGGQLCNWHTRARTRTRTAPATSSALSVVTRSARRSVHRCSALGVLPALLGLLLLTGGRAARRRSQQHAMVARGEAPKQQQEMVTANNKSNMATDLLIIVVVAGGARAEHKLVLVRLCTKQVDDTMSMHGSSSATQQRGTSHGQRRPVTTSSRSQTESTQQPIE